MALRLDKLRASDAAAQAVQAHMRNGPATPFELPVADIRTDPHQPRTEFSGEAMDELIASVKERGIRTPISVRRHPSEQGKWIINHGERRYRAAVALRLPTIPAFLDETHNDFDQVIENLQRDDLKPMELALFIQRKLAEGMKAGQIASHLGVKNQLVSYLQALIDPPAFLEALYRSGRCTAIQALWALRKLHDAFPDEVERWVERQEDITQAAVRHYGDELKNPQAKSAGDAANMNSKDQFAAVSPGGPGTIAAGAGRSLERTPPTLGGAPGREFGDVGGDHVTVSTKIGKIKKPCLLISYRDEAGAVLLDRHPSNVGKAWIKLHASGDTLEVAMKDLQLVSLTEG
ncbi:ParB/RepB/Spo0J family partition protein [Methylovirgula sp. 4M-Z18]|uniref:ParB/RepB/Spo0J family partition protein n=1 Tax=Methylovirgula sp. 4M-Z18 TaxID=2293567 RepID=UPI000E2F5B95|nr:ParB/RepB/Spo0J family partition protein [Methylovirgula sp. 4M-Z18]RFB76650.1 ParB/RepB/Spo0J family partition protein [Methylovirgula sp. 4M-Z18]